MNENIAEFSEGGVKVVVYRLDGSYRILSSIAGLDFVVEAGMHYHEPARAVSDARVLFHLLNGVEELLS